jgi:hypothetical protein
MERLSFLPMLFVLVERPLRVFLRARAVFDVYFDAIVLWIIASLPLYLFNYYTLLTMLVMCSVIDLV